MSNHSTPLVSVILPVYNAEPYLSEAIESILNQSFTDFELIAIDDGSTDNSWETLSSYAARDSRIVLSRNSENLKVIETFNKGIKSARGQYIARMDADDIALPERFAQQVAYLEQHPHVDLLSAGFYRLYPNGEQTRYHPPIHHTVIRWQLLFFNVICNPLIMFRRSLYEQRIFRYQDCSPAEDYDLWARISPHIQFGMLPDALLIYRDHDSTSNPETSDRMARKISDRQLRALLPEHQLTDAELINLRQCYRAYVVSNEVLALCPLIWQLFDVFAQQSDIDRYELKQLERQWTKRRLANLSVSQFPFIASLLRRIISQRDYRLLALAMGMYLPRWVAKQVWYIVSSNGEQITQS